MSEGKAKEKDEKEETRLRVYARVRPAFAGEFDKGGYNVLELGEDTKTVSLKERTYEFDRVFAGSAEQGDIFETVARPTIDNAFDGFTGTVFVYGQTGTGKTHTMSNRSAATADQGIIPRAVSYLFDRMNQENHAYTLTMQYLQLYRDNLQDLQAPDTPTLRLENTQDGGTHISGIKTSKPLANIEEFFDVYDEADQNRVVAETMMNKQSSRGHSVLTLFLKREAKDNLTPAVNGKLVFVDLAGYERIKKTMITDEIRKHEAQSINLSLSALATCIAAITSKATHVPFRNSRLTRILYDSLVGNSVTSVIITLGPSSLHTTETVNTLYFGHNAIQCKTTVKRDTGPVDWQKEALDWKARASELTKQVTKFETENTLLAEKLNVLDGEPTEGVGTPKSSSRDLIRMKSGLNDNQGLEKVLEELQRVKQELVESKVQLRNAEEETEYARVSTEETAWLLEQERGRVVTGEANEVDLRRQVELLRQQVSIANEQLELADSQLSQLVPDSDFAPTHEPSIRVTGTIHEHNHAKGTGIKPVYITYDTDKYVSWAALVTSELDHAKVNATVYDRSHWYVSVPDMARYVADDRKEFRASYMEFRSPQRSVRGSPLPSPSPAREGSGSGKIRIEGKAVVMETLEADLGDVEVTRRHEIVWEVSSSGYDFQQVGHVSGEARLYVSADLCHKYVRASLRWQEKRLYSQLVYINLPSALDEQLQQYVLQGGTLFEVLAATSESSNVNTKTSLAVECSGAVVLANEEEEHLFEVGTVKANIKDSTHLILESRKSIEVKTASRRECELIVLVLKLFKALRTTHVAEKMLGDISKLWLDGTWLNDGKDGVQDRMALQPRLRAASKSGHWCSGVVSPTKHAGGQSTFLLRAEELQELRLGGVANFKGRDASGSRTSEVLVERMQSFHSPASTTTQPMSPLFIQPPSTSPRQRGNTMGPSAKGPARRGNVFTVPQNSFGPRKMSAVQQKRNSIVPLSALALKANDYLTEVSSVGTSDGTSVIQKSSPMSLSPQHRMGRRSVQIMSKVQVHGD